MIFIPIRWIYLLSIIFFILFAFSFAQEESLSTSSNNFLPYPGIVHIHSNISSGIYPPRKIVTLAKDKGIKILIFTDTFLRRWEYGLPALSNILKVSIEENSVVKYGIKRYLKDLKKLKTEFNDMVILEGIEVAPFYWWQGNPFKKNLILNDWNRHLLVIGLRGYKDYKHLPVVHNRYFLPQLKDMPSLTITISLIILGIFLLKRKQKKFLGLTLTIAGILLLLNLFPFSASKYNPYYGKKDFLPHQDLINYVHKKEGLVFWAHPEITELTSLRGLGGVNFYTPSYPEALMLTSGYTGFGVNMLAGTNHDLILLGGQWDEVLINYCYGKIKQPVWAIGEQDYRGKGSIDSVQNIFFLSEFNQESVYKALHNGRFYVRCSSDISLSNFYIKDSKSIGEEAAFMGSEIDIKGKPQLHIKGNYNIDIADLRLEIVRNGELLKEFRFDKEGVFDLEFQDDLLPMSAKKVYYRLIFFAGRNIILLTNPIFVKIGNE